MSVIDDLTSTLTGYASDVQSTIISAYHNLENTSEAGIQTITAWGKQVGKEMRDRLFGKANKGIDYRLFIGRESQSSDQPFTITVRVADEHYKRQEEGPYGDDIKMYLSDLPVDETAGEFSFTVKKHDETIAYKYIQLNTLSGNLDGGNMTDIAETQSIIGPDFTACYGLYDARWGMSDQAWMYVTGNQSSWMKKFREAHPEFYNDRFHLAYPFSLFTLPGAHDAGMFTVDSIVEDVIQRAGSLPFKGLPKVAASIEGRVIRDLSVTQKDDITTLLNIGIRYFDFRPGYCYTFDNDNDYNNLYHQHRFIPGCKYIDFLKSVVQFLMKEGNEYEIVVIALSFAGFENSKMEPDADTLERALSDAIGTAPLVKGTKEDLILSHNDLCGYNKRIIFLNEDGLDTVAQYDSYEGNSSHYESVDNRDVLECLNKMNREGQAGKDITIFQLQGTPTAVHSEIINTVGSHSMTSSPLLRTKPNFDKTGYDWITKNVADKFMPSQIVAFLNDFADNQLVYHSINISYARFEMAASEP